MRSLSRTLFPFFLFVFAFVLLPSLAFPQLPPAGDTTSTPAPGEHDYFHSPVETVNPANGSVSIRIPVRMPPGRQLTVPFSFAYDSNGAFYVGPPTTGTGGSPRYETIQPTVYSQGGWSYSFPVMSFQSGSWTIPGSLDNLITCYGSFNYVFQDPGANRHNLNLSVSANVASPDGYDNCNAGLAGDGEAATGAEGPISAATSIPASNINSFPATSVADGNGTVYSFRGGGPNTYLATSVVDRNGNSVIISNAGYPSYATTYTDTLGRTALNTSGFGGNPDTISLAGLSSAYKVYWTTASANFTDNMLNMCQGAGCVACPTSMVASTAGISSVVLPNGQQFTFTYDPTYGMLTKVLYPSGGYVRYVWGLNSQAEAIQTTNAANGTIYFWDCRYDFPAITDRYVSYDGSTETLHQHFAYTTNWPNNTSLTWNTKSTTVTTTDSVRNTSFTTFYNYSPINAPHVPNGSYITPQIPVESTIQYNDPTGKFPFLKKVTKNWASVRILLSEQTTLENNQSTFITNCYDVNEQITETDQYDLGTGAPTLQSCASAPPGTQSGSLLRRTTKTYATFSGAHIVDLPATVITSDGMGNRVAETDTSYDETNNPNRGNPTTIAKRCFTAPGGQPCPQGDSITKFTYDNNGQMLTMNDPRSNTTTYSYTDNYNSCGGHTPPTSPSDAYLTQVTFPLTNGVSHIETYCYDYISGLKLSTTDQNNLTTIYKYGDVLDRLTETDFPDGGKTTVGYNDAPPSPRVTTFKMINSTGLTEVTLAIGNGFGQVKQTQLTSDPQGTIYQDTAYDGLGRVYTVSNPYRSGSDPTTTTGTTSYAYDSLGRKLSTTYPDGSVLATAYCGPYTLVTDPTGKWRRSRMDGLGRLAEVDEPSASGPPTNTTGCPGSETVWATIYGYDGLGNLISVIQKGSRSRSFTYDSLSRLLCSSNPENSFAPCPTAATSTYTSGTLGYTYDMDGNVTTKIISTSHLAGTSGSGSATVNGSEQSILGAPGVSGAGSVTFSGTLQSKQVVTTPATHATGSISIQGGEQSGTFCDDTGRHCHFKYDTGSVTIYVNGTFYTQSYGQFDTPNTIAANLTSRLNSGGVVTATVSANTISLTSVATGAAANYSLSTSSITNDPADFGGPSFVAFPSGSTLTGGHDNVYTTLYDSGTSTITVNGHGNVVSWSGSGTTTSSIASALASNINADSGAYVSASASGATVNLTAKTVGVSTDYSLSSSYTYDSTDFSSPSFTSSNSGAALTGGRDPGTTVYDTGSVWIVLNGTQYSVSYGQGNSTSSLAGTLASAISAGTLANATANGSGISLTAKTIGAVTNYSLSSGSSTSQPGSFSSPSFSVSVSGGSLTGGTDPDSPVVTSYTYDALNRLLTRSYSNGDPSVSITYDQSNCLSLTACQNVGQRTSMTDAAGSEAWSYEVDSTHSQNIHVNRRTTNNITKTSTYYLDLAGNITQAVYPTGRVVNYAYDAANRPKTATDGSNGITYASDFETAPTGCLAGAVCYTPQGSFYALSIGQSSTFAGLNLTHTYNNRLQPNEFRATSSGGNAIDISYGFVDPVTSRNAGHVYAITNNLDTTRSQTFTYDQLNRITGALTTSTHASSPTHCWGESYSLDPWGNLNSIAATTNSNYTGCTEESGFSTTADGNNHLPIFSYDLSGNTQSDGTISYTWDAESELKSAINAGVTTNYTYDGEGRRVSKSSGKLYWYGSGGDILAETDASGNLTAEYTFFGAKRIAMLPAAGNPIYYVEDLLGTSRVITTNSGVVCYDADFYPYGGERAYTNTCQQNYKFEGKERDTETGNDDFGARYYSNRFGRWLSSDWSSVPIAVPYANLANPQTLNLYSMVADDPESFADLDGHRPATCSGCDWDANWNAGIDALSCAGEPESCWSVAQAVAATTQLQAENLAEQTANQQQSQAQRPAWSSLSAAQQGLVSGGEQAWNALSNSQGANFAAITHALEVTTLSDGSSGLSQVGSVTSIGQVDIGVTWKAGAQAAFKASGFTYRWSLDPGESGLIGKPNGKGGTEGSFFQAEGMHVLFNDKNKLTGHVHIDYRSGAAHFEKVPNNDVRALGPNNYNTYKSWYGPIPGYTP